MAHDIDTNMARLGRYLCQIKWYGLDERGRDGWNREAWTVEIYGDGGRLLHTTEAKDTRQAAIAAAREWAGEQDGRDE